MRHFFLILFALLITATASAREYGHYNRKLLVTVSDTPAGKKYDFDTVYFDQILNDLSTHAVNYPPRFDTPQDKQRATQDVKALSGMLDILINVPAPNPAFLVRAGALNSIGHNLNIPNSAEKTHSAFHRLLAIQPADPQGNYLFGTFLGGSGKPKEALPYLEKALSLGVTNAAYAIGMTYLSLGNKEAALRNLEDYKRRKPDDRNVSALIDAIRNGKIKKFSN